MPDTNKPRPIYVDRLPPCNNACPSGQNIQKWLSLVEKNKFKAAWLTIMQDNPIPATMGRVCYHPCEGACNRSGFDAAVNINAVERFLGDMALIEHWTVDSEVELSSHKVMVVGAGPAGLSCAYHLTRMGHDVTVFDARGVGGGMMHYGIPAYRLPRNVLDAEVKRIENMGVKFVFNYRIEDVLKEKERGGFGAVFVAVGAPSGRVVNVPQTGSECQIFDAVQFLDAIEQNDMPNVKGNKVVVYGGGNTAIDAARCAVRLGAKEIEIVYRRNREKMPAYDFEVNEAQAEGVTLRLLRTIEKIDGKKVTLNVMELNAEGWPEDTNKKEAIQADTLIMSLGLNVDTEFLQKISEIKVNKDGTIEINDSMETTAKGIFAGGDVVPYDRSVTTAIGHGKKAARNINAFLCEEMYQKPGKNELAGRNKLHTNYYEKADRKERTQNEYHHGGDKFSETIQGLNEGEVVHEAKRCFSCGNCFECDTCYKVCPVKAITKLGAGKGYRIDYDICIRCGLCARKCPCGAMKMIED